MNQPSKRLKRLIRDAAAVSYQRELAAELGKLEEEFQRWRRGEISAFELSDRIHVYHQGPNRDLYCRYNTRDADMAVARALHHGVLKESDISPEVLAYAKPMCEIFRQWDQEEQSE